MINQMFEAKRTNKDRITRNVTYRYANGQTPLGESLMLNIGGVPQRRKTNLPLSEILEDNVPEKYYLSPKACLGILRRAKNKGRKLPDNLRIALEQKVAEGGRS